MIVLYHFCVQANSKDLRVKGKCATVITYVLHADKVKIGLLEPLPGFLMLTLHV